MHLSFSLCTAAILSATAITMAAVPASARQRTSQTTVSAPEIQALRRLYVSLNGDDKNNGLSPQTAFKSPQKAADLSLPGDAILFAAGTYEITAGGAALTITRSGEAGKPIVYAPMPGAVVTFHNRVAWETIKVSGARYIEIRGFRVQGHSDEVTLEEARREANNLKNPRTCENGIGVTWDAETKAPAAHVTVRNCEVFNCGGGGTYASHADYITFENNVVYRCAFWSPYANSAISIYQPMDVDDSTAYKMVIRGNVAFENYENIPFFYSNKDPEKRKVTDGNGIIVDDFLNTQAFGGGAGKAYQGRTLVANNIVFDNDGSGIHAFKSTNVDIVNNLALGNNRHPQIKDGQIFANSAQNVRILNNIMFAPPGLLVNLDYKNEGVVYDFNLYASTDGSAPKFVGDQSNNRLASPGLVLSDWAKGNRALVIEAKTPLQAAGTPFPDVATDFFGHPRDAKAPDIGPFALAATGAKLDAPIAVPIVAAVRVAPQVQIEDANRKFIENGDFSQKMTVWDIHAHGKNKLNAEIVAGPKTGTSTLRVTVEPGENLKKYSVGALQTLGRSVAANQKLRLRFWARSPQSSSIAAMIQQPKAPYRRAFYKEVPLTPEWTSYEISGASPEAFAVGGANLEFFLSLAPGQVEMASVEVVATP